MLALIDVDPSLQTWTASILGVGEMPDEELRDYLAFAAEYQRQRPLGAGGVFVAILPDA